MIVLDHLEQLLLLDCLSKTTFRRLLLLGNKVEFRYMINGNEISLRCWNAS